MRQLAPSERILSHRLRRQDQTVFPLMATPVLAM
jgi:hypothetical protein